MCGRAIQSHQHARSSNLIDHFGDCFCAYDGPRFVDRLQKLPILFTAHEKNLLCGKTGTNQAQQHPPMRYGPLLGGEASPRVDQYPVLYALGSFWQLQPGLCWSGKDFGNGKLNALLQAFRLMAGFISSWMGEVARSRALSANPSAGARQKTNQLSAPIIGLYTQINGNLHPVPTKAIPQSGQIANEAKLAIEIGGLPFVTGKIDGFPEAQFGQYRAPLLVDRVVCLLETVSAMKLDQA